MTDQSQIAVAVDVGSYTIKSGLCCGKDCSDDDASPRMFRAVLETSGASAVRIPGVATFAIPGAASVLAKGSVQKSVRVVRRGNVMNREHFKQLMDRVYKETLSKKSDGAKDCKVILSTPAQGSTRDRAWHVEHHFENLSVSSLSLENQGLLSLSSVGALSGVALEIGHDLTQVVPVFEGTIIEDAARTLHRGGSDLDNFMLRLLAKEGQRFISSSSDTQTARYLKEMHAHLAIDFSKEMKDAMQRPLSCTLPDGAPISLSVSRLLCPEMLFRPEIAGMEMQGPGVHKVATNALYRCPVDVTTVLAKQIVLGGGTTRTGGFGKRFEAEMSRLCGKRFALGFDYKGSVYRGACVISKTFPKERWITSAEYKESGVDRIMKRIA